MMSTLSLVLAPAGLVALPLAALLGLSRFRGRAGAVLGAVSVTLALWWLARPGELPHQTARAAAVIATAAFALTTVLTRWTVVHRALISVAGSALAVTGGYVLFGWSWARLHWWVAYRAGQGLRFLLGGMWATARLQGDGQVSERSATLLNQLEAGYPGTIRTAADLFPGALALQLLAALWVAAAVYYGVGRGRVGRALGPFRAFRFTEHLGWAAVLAGAVALLPKVGALKVVAWNVLGVAGALYTLRGAAVAAAAVQLFRASAVLYVIGVVALLFLLPVVLGGSLMLGVLDTKLDFRRRWTGSPARK